MITDIELTIAMWSAMIISNMFAMQIEDKPYNKKFALFWLMIALAALIAQIFHGFF